MYGTIARMKVKRENLDALKEPRPPRARPVAGFRSANVLGPTNGTTRSCSS